MCGRLAVYCSTEELSELFGITMGHDIEPRYNIAYSGQVNVIVHNGVKRLCTIMEWGLIPAWAKTVHNERRLTHARAETLLEKPSFRESVQKRRCIIPISSFFDWEDKGTYKQPWNISISEHPILCIAGIWDTWLDPATGIVKHTVAVITVNPNEEFAAIHDRMPAILTGPEMELWLHPLTSTDDALAVLHPYRGAITMIPVSRDVNSVKNDGEYLIQRIEIPTPKVGLFD